MSEFNREYSGDKLTPLATNKEIKEHIDLVDNLESPEMDIYLEQYCDLCEHEMHIEEIQLRRSRLPAPLRSDSDTFPKKFIAENITVKLQETIGSSSQNYDWPFYMRFEIGNSLVEVRSNDRHTELVVTKEGKIIPIRDFTPQIATELLGSILSQISRTKTKETDSKDDDDLLFESEPDFTDELTELMGDIARYEGSYAINRSTPIIDLDDNTKIYLSNTYYISAGASPDNPGMSGLSTSVNILQSDEAINENVFANLEYTFMKYEDVIADGEKRLVKNSYLAGRLVESKPESISKPAVFSELDSIMQIDPIDDPECWEENIATVNCVVRQALHRP
jgi:hypothetical protein